MLDIKFIRAFPDKVKYAVRVRKAKTDVDEILKLDDQRLEMLSHVESHRALRNSLSEQVSKTKVAKERAELIKEALRLKIELKKFENDLKILEGKLNEKLLYLPNIPCSNMPIGDGPDDNVELAVWTHLDGYLPKKKLGKGNSAAKYMPEANFKMKDHIELGKMHDMIDVEQSAITSGSRFCYLKNDAVLLQDALASLLKKKLVSEGFVPKMELPYKMFALTSCFRSEVGSWGKDVYGIKRVHQFDKLEMDVVTIPETSDETMEYLREINEWFLQQLQLPYRVLNKCSADAGYLASHKQYDAEVWLPSQREFMEVMTDTNATDFQARRLNIRFKDGGSPRYAHTVNDTGCAMGRMIISILDNYQKEDGTIKVPEALQKLMGKKE